MCVSRYWELATQEWGLGRRGKLRGFTGGRKAGCVARICWGPLGMKQGGETTAGDVLQNGERG